MKHNSRPILTEVASLKSAPHIFSPYPAHRYQTYGMGWLLQGCCPCKSVEGEKDMAQYKIGHINRYTQK